MQGLTSSQPRTDSDVDPDVVLRRELTRLIENYALEVGTVLAPTNPETIDARSYRIGFNAGARAALSRAVTDLKEALA